jgi:dihydroorotate dehydrogenase electron transfer subunit
MNPPRIVHTVAPVIENVGMARDTYRLRFRCPEMAAAIRPGQFLMLRIPGRSDPLLGRAFALYDVIHQHGHATEIDIVYLVVGKMTRLMAEVNAGSEVEVWGPLGNGFPSYEGVSHLVMVAGGIGQTPFLSLAKQVLGHTVERVTFLYGVRNAGYVAGLDDFKKAGAAVQLASDDGSVGYRGFVTQLLEREWTHFGPVAEQRWVGCGPEPMLHALARLAERCGVACDLSLETPMACGVGICFSCVTPVMCDSGWDYRRVCVEGPIFNAAELVWQT